MGEDGAFYSETNFLIGIKELIKSFILMSLMFDSGVRL